MDIWTFISVCSAIYLIWYYRQRRKLKKAIKAEEKRLRLIEQEKKRQEEEKVREQERRKEALGVTENSEIQLEKICTWEENSDGSMFLRFTPPFDCSARLQRNNHLLTGCKEDSIVISIEGFGKCHYTFGLGVTEIKMSHIVFKNDIVAKFTPGFEAVKKKQQEQELARAERIRRAEEREKAEIARKVKERQRKRDLEKIVTQELIDSGDLFGEQPMRPQIPREVVDAVYRRDGGRCVYCGSTENLQLDHIIPFSKGGATTLENLQLLCQPCNLKKSNHIG